MKLEQSFDVAAPVERVWKALIDVEHVAPCLPGAAVTGRNDDGSYAGTFTVKIGPTSASYTGKLQMEEIDEAAHTARMHAQGTDKRGQGGATATILSTVRPSGGDGTHVEVVTDYHITGRLARFGRGGMIEDISARLLQEFARRLQDSLVEQPAAESTGEEAAGTGPAGDANGGPPAGPRTDSESQTLPNVSQPPPATPGAVETEPLQGLSLVGSVMWERTKRNPLPLVLGLLLALFVLRRARR